jgi:2-dehydropantoate 2-reductase
VVPLLNGVDHIVVLRERFGSQRVVPGTIASETEKSAPGRFIQRSPSVRLNLAASGEPLLNDVMARLDKVGFVCKFIANEQTLLWGKLCFLGPFALVNSASGKSAGEIRADTAWQRQLTDAAAEACAVANASGAEIVAEQIQTLIASVPAAMRSSMQKDLTAGRELELDAIGGPIVRGGERYSIDVSTTAKLMEAIRAKSLLPNASLA